MDFVAPRSLLYSMKQWKISYLFLFLFFLLLCLWTVGCQKTQPADAVPVTATLRSTSTMAPTTAPATTTIVETPTETQTEVPTPTPTQTPTWEPTETLTPSPTQTTTPTKSPTKAPTPSPTPKITIPHIELTPTAIPDTLDASKPMIALTFDDGPTTTVTNRILDVLEQYHAKATFFVIGDRLGSSGCKATVSRAYALGCEIGSHSYTHPKMQNLSVAEIQTEFRKTNTAIEKIIGVTPTLFRPPYGYVNNAVRAYANAPLIFWSVDPQDWDSRNAAKIYKHVMSKVQDGDIILMHDLYGSTAEACESLIPALLNEGYQLVTVSELFACKGITLTTGDTFRKAR